MIKAVIFDIGGVLAYDVWEHLFLDKEHGIATRFNLDADQVRKVGKELWERFSCQAAIGEQDWSKLEEEYWNCFIERFHLSIPMSSFIQMTDKFIKPVQEMPQLLEKLRLTEVDLAICSNNTEFWFKRQLDKLGLYKFFPPDKIILSSRIGIQKSSQGFEMFHAIMNALKLDKAHCIFIDDRQENIQQSLTYGLTGIIFPSHATYGARYLEVLLQKMGIF
jgi:FMN phosphatase YigB (HAD superfamily)